MAQYTRNRDIIEFTIFAYFENKTLKIEPKSDQSRVHINPIKARSKAKVNNSLI